jgi:hypothetical protein
MVFLVVSKAIIIMIICPLLCAAYIQGPVAEASLEPLCSPGKQKVLGSNSSGHAYA